MLFVLLQEMMKQGIPISPLMRFQFEIWKMDIRKGEKILLGDLREEIVYELGYNEIEDRIFIKEVHPMEKFIKPI